MNMAKKKIKINKRLSVVAYFWSNETIGSFQTHPGRNNKRRSLLTKSKNNWCAYINKYFRLRQITDDELECVSYLSASFGIALCVLFLMCAHCNLNLEKTFSGFATKVFGTWGTNSQHFVGSYCSYCCITRQHYGGYQETGATATLICIQGDDGRWG